MNHKIVTIILFVLFLVSPVFAEDYTNLGKTMRYVRAGATGGDTGLDWTNAYTSLPVNLTRDYVYFVAGGSYSSYTFDDANSGTDRIYIVKATEDDHGTDTGWLDSFDDDQAEWTTWTLNASYMTFDGQTGGGPDSWTSGHGFLLDPVTCNEVEAVGANTNVVNVASTATSNNIFTRIEIALCGVRRQDGIYQKRDTAFRSTQGIADTTFSYMYIHDVSGIVFLLYGGDNSGNTIEYNFIQRQATIGGAPSNIHAEVLQLRGAGQDSGTIIRYNRFNDVDGTGCLTFQDSAQSGIEIYGNVFYQTDPESAIYTLSTGVIYAGQEDHDDIEIYNNTVVDFGTYPSGINMDCTHTGVIVRNNLWSNSSSNSIDSNTASNNEQSGSTSLFSDYSNDDFTLSQATDEGFTLGSPYNVDMYGNTRGSDGSWDLGAYEYVSGTAGNTQLGSGIPVDISDPTAPTVVLFN